MSTIDDLNKVFYDLLQVRRSSPEKTSVFNDMKHNNDLCPAVQQKIETIAESFKKYKRITYDIQGLRDKGADIIFKEEIDDNNYFVCFQIKSQWDLDQPDYLQKIKSQIVDSQAGYKEQISYYLLICCDIVTDRSLKSLSKVELTKTKKLNSQAIKNRDKIRNITADLSGMTKLTIIEPQFVKTFLDLPLTQIDAIVKLKFGEEDIVYKRALETIGHLMPSEIAVLCFFIVERIETGKEYIKTQEIVGSGTLNQIYQGIPCIERDVFQSDISDYEFDEMTFKELKDLFSEKGLVSTNLKKQDMLDHLKANYKTIFSENEMDVPSRIENDIEYLLDHFIYTSENDESYMLDLKSVNSLMVFILDAKERFGYDEIGLIKYIINLFNINNIVFEFDMI